MNKIFAGFIGLLLTVSALAADQTFKDFVPAQPAAATQTGAELIPQVQGGATVKVTSAALGNAGTLTGDVTKAAASTSTQVTVTHLSAPLSVAQGGTGVATSTGTGSTVLSTSPTLVTPALGTPSALVLTSATGLPLATGVTGTLQAAQEPAHTGDVTNTAGSLALTIAVNAATNAKSGQMPAQTVKCNTTTSTANASDCLVPDVNTLMSAMISATVVSQTNIALSGTQTIDGRVLVAGETVLVQNQSTNTQNGLYIVQSGAWTRAITMPSGYVFAANCNVAVFIRYGTEQQGHTYRLTTVSGAITVGTTPIFFQDATLGNATQAVYGLVQLTDPGIPAAGYSASNAPTSGDCVSFADSNGTISLFGDAFGNTGPCAVQNPTTGALLFAGDVPTASAGTIQSNSTNNRGRVTGLTAATALTITFVDGPFPAAPSCGASASSALAVGVSSVSATAVTFTMAALTGSLNYWCF